MCIDNVVCFYDPNACMIGYMQGNHRNVLFLVCWLFELLMETTCNTGDSHKIQHGVHVFLYTCTLGVMMR